MNILPFDRTAKQAPIACFYGDPYYDPQDGEWHCPEPPFKSDDSSTLDADASGSCQCLWGYATVDADGNCTCGPRPLNGGGGVGVEIEPGPPELHCADGYKAMTINGQQYCVPINDTAGLPYEPRQPKPLIRTGAGGPWAYSPLGGTSVVNTDPARKRTPPAASGNATIFGFSPLVVIGAAAAGLFLLSTMDTKGGKRNV